MIEKEVLEVLIKFGYAVVIDNKPVFTKKFKDLIPTPESEITAAMLVTSLPSRLASLEEKKAVWNQFIQDADIPHRVTSTTGTYTVRQFSKPAADKLWKIVSDPAVDYDRFVASTRHYYKTVSYKLLLSNYLINDVWKDEYREWEKVKSTPAQDGSNWMES